MMLAAPSPAAVDLDGWARFVMGMHLRVVLYFLAVVAAAAGLAVLLGLTRLAVHRHRARLARKLFEAAKLGPDGRGYPPSGRGMCDACQRAFEKVYYMPDGQRLCPACHAGRRKDRPEELSNE